MLLDLATLGPPYDFGAWLQGALAREPLELRWPDLDEAGALRDVPSCVITWSDPTRSGDQARQLRGQLRHGGGMLYVVGTSRGHLSAARAFWAPLDVNLQSAAGGSGFPEWGDHPLTEGLTSLGATMPRCLISGPGGEALVVVAGQATAMAFDWGEQGRCVIMDQALLGDALSSRRPRPAMREFLVRCVRWAAEARTTQPSPRPQPGPKPEPQFEMPEPAPIQPISSNIALVDMGADDDNWPSIRARVVEALKAADLEVEMAAPPTGEQPLLTNASLDGIGILVIGSCRQFQPSEPIAVSRFYATGGRLLLLPHVENLVHNRFRMIYFNDILVELELAASLARPHGQTQFFSHPITEGLTETIPVPGGVKVQSYLADTLLEVAGLPAAVALQSESSRLVLMDAGLLLPTKDEQAPARELVTMLGRSVRWLTGEM